MEQGTIQKVLNYYFETPKFKKEFFRALGEFFDQPDIGPGKELKLQDKTDEEMFNEWFVFDFKLSNGKTLLEDFCDTNPYNFNITRLQVYKDLQENCFGIYKVKEIKWGEGLILENLQTGKIHQVREFTATFGLKIDQVFSNRIGKVGDHYELVGSNAGFGPVKIDDNIENSFRKEKNKLNPKILRNSFLGSKEDEENEAFSKRPVFLQEAEEELNKVLKKYNLIQFVDTSIIKEWIYNHSTQEGGTFELNLLCSLLYPDMKDYKKALMEILESLNVFYNLCPQKVLEGKSPLEKEKEREQKGILSDFKMSHQPLPPLDWGKKYKKALDYMQEAKFKQALKKLDEIFVYLLKNKITYPEIYRIYTNKGICHFVLGEIKIGKFMFETSVELNPFYDFAKQQLKKCSKKEYDFDSKKIKRKQNIIQDIGYKYYQFLKPLKINFAQVLKEHSIMTIKK